MSETLTYDNLPQGSSLLREYDDGLTITAPAGEPTPALQKQTSRQAAVPAALITAFALAVCLLAFGSMAVMHRNMLPWWIGGLFTVFCLAMFLLVWQVRYVNRLDALQRALTGSTILVARHGKLLIESTGPDGAVSHELPRENIRAIGVLRNHRRSEWGHEQPMDCVAIVPREGEPIYVLAGRTRPELEWAARNLRQALESS